MESYGVHAYRMRERSKYYGANTSNAFHRKTVGSGWSFQSSPRRCLLRTEYIHAYGVHGQWALRAVLCSTEHWMESSRRWSKRSLSTLQCGIQNPLGRLNELFLHIALQNHAYASHPFPDSFHILPEIPMESLLTRRVRKWITLSRRESSIARRAPLHSQ